jgi:predicted phage tail protein
MTERLRTIRLYGKLGARFGRRFRLAVNSPAEAVHALCTMLPGFQQYLMGAKAKGMEFAVFAAGRTCRGISCTTRRGRMTSASRRCWWAKRGAYCRPSWASC